MHIFPIKILLNIYCIVNGYMEKRNIYILNLDAFLQIWFYETFSKEDSTEKSIKQSLLEGV